jgi:hypothetical protein
MPFIAFLDADDIYMRDRFSLASRIFNTTPNADGVYEGTGARFLKPELRDRYHQVAGGDFSGIRRATTPEELFGVLAAGKHGYIHLNALTLKREVLTQNFLFDSELVMGEDMDFTLRLAARYRLFQGDTTNVVALRGIHGDNSIFTNPRAPFYRRKYLQKCIDNQFYGTSDLKGALYIVSRRIGAARWYQPFRRLGKLALPIKLVGIAVLLLLQPRTIKGLWSVMVKQ